MSFSNTPLATESARYGAGMIRRFGWFHYLLGLRRPIGQMRLDQASALRVQEAAKKGPVVYLLLRANNLDHLALNRVLASYSLPLSIWAWNITQFFWEPVTAAWSGLFRRTLDRVRRRGPQDPVSGGFLARALKAEQPITVFLEPNTSLFHRVFVRRGRDPIPELLAIQDRFEQPIQVLPIVVVWQRGLDREAHPAVRAFLPDADRVWWPWRLFKLAWYPSDNFVQVGEACDLQTFNSRIPNRPERERIFRIMLRRFLRRESQVVRGPRLPSAANLQQLVLENPPMRELADREALRSGNSVAAVRRKMSSEYRRMAAHMRWSVIRVLDLILRPLWTVVYQGVDAPEEDMERVREAMRNGAAIVLPSHKSHMDYLLIAWVFYRNKLTLPHVVAGDNLAIPFVAFFLRSAGGFFIKRSFKNETLHPAIVGRYIQELVHHGVPLEFYLEGGRTRTGKLLRPKVGILGMVFDAAAIRPTGQEATLLPVALAYERVAEGQAYLRELGGKAKSKENLGQAVRATSILRKRYGRVYLRVGEPIALSSVVDATPDQSRWHERSDADRKTTLVSTAQLVMHEIGMRTVLLPTTLISLALMSNHTRGVRTSDLTPRIERFLSFILRFNIPIAKSLSRPTEATRLTLDQLHRERFLEHEVVDGERVWAVRPERRIALDFYKNQGMHPFVNAGLVACALVASRAHQGLAGDLEPHVERLMLLWEREWSFHPTDTASTVLAQGLIDLSHHGALTLEPHFEWKITDSSLAAEIYALFVPLLECYRCVCQYIAENDGRVVPSKQRSMHAHQSAERSLAKGELTRPEALNMVTIRNALSTLTAVDDTITPSRVDHADLLETLTRMLPHG